MLHTLSITKETIQEEPEPGEQWARYQTTGNGQTTCSCGLDTGLVTIEAATRAYTGHETAIRIPKPPAP